MLYNSYIKLNTIFIKLYMYGYKCYIMLCNSYIKLNTIFINKKFFY